MRNQVNLEVRAESSRGPCQSLQSKITKLAGLNLCDHRLADSRARGKRCLRKPLLPPQVGDFVLNQDLSEFIFYLASKPEFIDLFVE
jgi:hypothetical protein